MKATLLIRSAPCTSSSQSDSPAALASSGVMSGMSTVAIFTCTARYSSSLMVPLSPTPKTRQKRSSCVRTRLSFFSAMRFFVFSFECSSGLPWSW